MERFTLLVTDFENTVDAGQDELKEKEDTLRVKNEELLELKVRQMTLCSLFYLFISFAVLYMYFPLHFVVILYYY